MRSFDDQLSMAGDDLDTATSLLSARPLAGDDELGARLVTEGLSRWRRNGRRWLDALRSRVIERRTQAGDVAYLLEPDLKDGHGGLRDVHTLWWAADADLMVPGRRPRRARPLLRRRCSTCAWHCTGRRAVRATCCASRTRTPWRPASGLASADAMMADVAAAARSIDWIADGAWRHVSRHQLGHEERVGDGLVVIDREVELTGRADVGADPVVVLRAARVAAQRDVGLARPTLDRLAAGVDAEAWADRWPDGALDELVALLQQGHRAIDVLEALDQRGILVRLVPEWDAGAQPPAAQRVPPLHRRPAPVGDGRQRRRPHRPGRAARPPAARRAVPRHRQGLPG